MGIRQLAFGGVVAAVILTLTAGAGARAPALPPATGKAPKPKESIVTSQASGSFDVKLAPLAAYDSSDGAPGRMSIDKVFHGDLEATSKGEMLAAMTGVEGSAGYVAIERVTGTLLGRAGTFVLQHSGTMTRGTPQLVVTVIPDSGTGQLAGLAGTMSIQITDQKHFYLFDFTLPEAPQAP